MGSVPVVLSSSKGEKNELEVLVKKKKIQISVTERNSWQATIGSQQDK